MRHSITIFRKTARIAILVGVLSLNAAEEKNQGDVSLSIKANRLQPMGMPVVIEVTLKNVGVDTVTWWCGGPDRYPGERYFRVETRLGTDSSWRSASSTNGQYTSGSGIHHSLKPGETIIVPLAVPVSTPRTKSASKLDEVVDSVHIRVEPIDWRSSEVAEVYAQISLSRQILDERRYLMISSISEHGTPFWKHVAEDYADDVVLDAMIKAASVDCLPLVQKAASVLAHQKTLIEQGGNNLALAVRHWYTAGNLCEDLVVAALKTHSPTARYETLEILKVTRDERVVRTLTEALMISPGDRAWMLQARDAVDVIRNEPGVSHANAEQAKRVIEWIEARMKYPQ